MEEKIFIHVFYNLARSNPDELLSGFIPVWAIVIYIISGKICLYIFMFYLYEVFKNYNFLATFLVLAIFSGICYILGCKSPKKQTFRNFDN